MKSILEEDILKELFNISVGKAASILSEIVEKKILLTVPKIKILDLKRYSFELEKLFHNVTGESIMISSISFKESLEGKASLIFPADKMKSFVNLCLKQEDKVEDEDLNFTDIDFDVLKEIGNIILNSIIGEIGNYINIKLEYTLPKIKVMNEIGYNDISENEDYTHMLILSVNFNVENTKIEGAVMINLTLKSIDQILKKINEMEENLNGQNA